MTPTVLVWVPLQLRIRVQNFELLLLSSPVSLPSQTSFTMAFTSPMLSSFNGTTSRYPIHSVAEVLESKPTGIDLYSRFALAGALGCAITHGALTPVDVVKTRIQLEPEVYNKVSYQAVVHSEGRA